MTPYQILLAAYAAAHDAYDATNVDANFHAAKAAQDAAAIAHDAAIDKAYATYNATLALV